MTTKPERRLKSLNITASRIPPTMQSLDFWAQAPTITATIRETTQGAYFEPGPSSEKANREGTARKSTNRKVNAPGRIKPC